MARPLPALTPASAAVPGGPRHVAIIMDGNGRWAKKRLLPRAAGHRAGVEAVRRTVRGAPALGVTALTLYAFSSENWRRPADEIDDLIGLLRGYIAAEVDDLVEQGARLRVIGDWRAFARDTVADIEAALERTAANDRLHLTIALNYGARDEVARAARALAEDVAAGRLEAAGVTPAALEARLDTAGLPPVDLIVRTSGEHRLSNFLLWQAAYAELWFTDALWPDFGPDHLAQACRAFAARERRFGGR